MQKHVVAAGSCLQNEKKQTIIQNFLFDKKTGVNQRNYIIMNDISGEYMGGTMEVN